MYTNTALLKVLLAASLASAETTSFKLLAQEISTSKNTPIGTLHYDPDTLSAEIVDAAEQLDAGSYRLGVQDGAMFKSFGYDELSQLAHTVELTVKPSGELATLSFSKSEAAGLHALVKPMARGPDPVVVYKTRAHADVAAAAAGAVEDEEGAQPQSFVQKYWMYLVPALIIIMMTVSEPEKK